jgi:peroxiredoxin
MPIEAGDMAPDFTLNDRDFQPVRLSDLRGRTVVLTFFPMAFSEVCTAQFTEVGPDAAGYAGDDALVVAVSGDQPYALGAFADALGADRERVVFLSDFHPRGEVARAYDVFIEERGHSSRAVFVVDAGGVVRHVERIPIPITVPDAAAVRAAVSACAV